MRALGLGGHYGATVDVDLCEHCHLLWFDSLEPSRLTGRAMLRLIGAMADAQREPHHLIEAGIRCPRCRGELKEVHNRSRFGAARQLECVRGHGAWSTFAQWLAERGLVRPLRSADRAALESADGPGTPTPSAKAQAWSCINCGAALPDHGDTACSHCGTQVGVVDIARLAAALDPEGATREEEVHRSQGRRHPFVCHACGHGFAGAATPVCPQCGATQISTKLREVHARVAHLDDALRRHEEKPAAHVVQHRMAMLSQDLDRRRDTIRTLEESTRADYRAPRGDSREGGLWDSLIQRWLAGLFGDSVASMLGKAGVAVLLLVALLWSIRG